MTKRQANIRNVRDTGNEINIIKETRIFLDCLTLKISTLQSFELFVNTCQITGPSQKTWIFINIAMKRENVPRKKQRKKIERKEYKENRKKRKNFLDRLNLLMCKQVPATYPGIHKQHAQCYCSINILLAFKAVC
jgi:hypothetical protein